MTDWDNVAAGSIVWMGLIQIDIAGHSKLPGTSEQISKAKEILRHHVEKIVAAYGGRLFKWEGDGGAYMFLIQHGSAYAEMVLGARTILADLSNINDEIAYSASFQQLISIRISCDVGNVQYHQDPSNMHGDFLNRFFKHERVISVINAVTITDRIWKEIPESLKQKFQHDKYSEEVGAEIYRTQRENEQPTTSPTLTTASEDDEIIVLREAIKSHHTFSREAEIIRLVRQVPRLEQVGAIELSAERRLECEKELLRKAAERGQDTFINDAHAVIKHEPSWQDEPVVIRYEATDYVGICALSDFNKTPVKTISASAVLLCSAKRELYLHRRSPNSRTYPSCLHTIGGGYMPPGVTQLDDKYDLIATAQREVREETSMNFLRNRNTRMLIANEPRTGFFQFVLLGVDIPCEEVEVKDDSWEGDVVSVEFDKLYDKLFSEVERWTPTGHAHLFAWLGLGAPPLSPTEKFGGRSAKELFTEAVKKLSNGTLPVNCDPVT